MTAPQAPEPGGCCCDHLHRTIVHTVLINLLRLWCITGRFYHPPVSDLLRLAVMRLTAEARVQIRLHWQAWHLASTLQDTFDNENDCCF
jgi:hypothetical protein